VRAGTVTDPNLVALRISGSRWITCASPSYLAQFGRPHRIADLAGHALIGSVPADATHPRPWIFPADTNPPFQPRFRMTVNEAEAVMLAAANGSGITQTMDLLAARALADGQLVIVLPEQTMRGPPLSIVHTQAAQRLARVRVFSLFLRELLQEVVRRSAAATGLPPEP